MTTAVVLVSALTIVVFRRCRRVVVTGTSMHPTLAAGDRLLVIRAGRPRPGHLVVIPDPRRPELLLVKRATAIEGNEVTVRGDNPDLSTDSREFGSVALDAIRGRAVYRYGPPERVGWLR